MATKYRTATLMIRLTDKTGKRRYCAPAYPAKDTLPKSQRAIVDGAEGHYTNAVYILQKAAAT